MSIAASATAVCLTRPHLPGRVQHHLTSKGGSLHQRRIGCKQSPCLASIKDHLLQACSKVLKVVCIMKCLCLMLTCFLQALLDKLPSRHHYTQKLFACQTLWHRNCGMESKSTADQDDMRLSPFPHLVCSDS